MNIYALPALAVFLVSIVLGVFILRKDYRDKFNRSFFLFALAVSIWVLGKFMKIADLDLASPDLWSMVEMVGMILTAPLMLYFVSLLQPSTNPALLKKPYIWLAIYALSLFFLLLLFNGYLVGEISPGRFGHEYNTGLAYDLFGAYYLLLLSVSVARLFSIFRVSRARDVTRTHSKLLFVGLFFAVLMTGVNDVIFPIMEVEMVPLTGFGLLLFEAFVVYATLEHKLFSVPQIRLFFTPVPEAFLKTKMKHKIESGYNYFFREKTPKHSADLFVDQVTHGRLGLWITSPHQKNPNRIGLRKTPVLFLTTELATGVASHPIDKLNSLITLVENEILLAGGRMLVMFDCFSDIVLVNTFKQALDFMHRLSQVCSKNASNLIVRVDASKFTKKQLNLLEISLFPVRVNVESDASH